MAQVKIDSIAPEFCLDDVAGRQVCLSDFRGRGPVVIVLNRGFA
jgi:peroxiredoxin